MRHVGEITNNNVEDLYTAFGWPLYRKYSHAYSAFKEAISNPTILSDSELKFTDPDVKEVLLKDINRRLTPQAAKLRADLEVTCFQYEGIDAIKAALQKGQDIGTQDIPIKIKLVAPPLFVMVTTSLDKDSGINLLNKAIEVIAEEIKKIKG